MNGIGLWRRMCWSARLHTGPWELWRSPHYLFLHLWRTKESGLNRSISFSSTCSGEIVALKVTWPTYPLGSVINIPKRRKDAVACFDLLTMYFGTCMSGSFEATLCLHLCHLFNRLSADVLRLFSVFLLSKPSSSNYLYTCDLAQLRYRQDKF